MVIHEWRQRKTGPEHRLMVARCETHDQHFTVYPPGYVPYGQQAVAPVTEEGSAWEGTVFAPAMEDGWLGEYGYSGGPSWQTRRRRLRYAGRLLGVAGAERLCETAAAALGVPLAVHLSARHSFFGADVHAQRAAVRSVLEAVPARPDLWRKVMRVGRMTGAWGNGWEWSGKTLVPLFRPTEERPGNRPARPAGATRDLTR